MNKFCDLFLAILLVSCVRPSVQKTVSGNKDPATAEQIEVTISEEDWLIIGGQKVDDFQTSHPTKEYFLNEEKEEIRSIELFIDPSKTNRTHSLEGIEDLINLKYIYIYGWNLDMLDYSPLKNLQNLGDITFDCGNVNVLNQMTRVPDFSKMAAKDTITEIEFRNCARISFENIKTLPNLRIFKAGDVSTPVFNHLNRLQYLEELDLYTTTYDRSTVYRLEEIVSLKNLEKIRLGYATVDIKGIDRLSSLKCIDFRLCDLVNTRYASLPESVERMQIEIREGQPDIEFIETAAGLKELFVESQFSTAYDSDESPHQILDVRSLKNLSGLERLFMRGFKIKNISALDGLEQLWQIDVRFSEPYDPKEKSKHKIFWGDGGWE